jgi:Ca2+-binding EF-hand superfamily protein
LFPPQLAESFLPPQQRTDEFIDRLFNAFDTDKSGEIDFREFMMAMNYSTSEKPDEKLAFYFKTLDIDNSGFLEEKEIRYAVELIFKVRYQGPQIYRTSLFRHGWKNSAATGHSALPYQLNLGSEFKTP